jgi:hypothetical protein
MSTLTAKNYLHIFTPGEGEGESRLMETLGLLADCWYNPVVWVLSSTN